MTLLWQKYGMNMTFGGIKRLKIEPYMIVLDVVEKHPETEEVFREYDTVIGKCLLCHNLFDSIESIAQMYAIDSIVLIGKLNKCIKGS